jgi:colanic acid biosynthesis glycosyl transferase WcaI
VRVHIISGVFPPEPVMTAMTSADVAVELTRRGHDVTVFAPFPNRPSGTVTDGFKRKLWDIEEKDGYRIIRTWHSLSKRSNFLSRTAENITFGLSSTLGLITSKPADVVYMNTWPIFSQNLNSIALKFRKVPIVCYVQDIYPESMTAKRLLKETNFLARMILKMDISHLKRCDLILTLADSMRDLLISQRNLSKDKITVVPNWLDESPYMKSYPKVNSFREQHGLDQETFVAMFAGSLTMSAGLYNYIDAAKHLRNRENIKILLVGDGSMRQSIEQQIKDDNLKNIQVIYPLLPSDVPEIQAAADVLLMSLSGSMAQNAAPSKQVAYMLSGRPIVASISSKGTPAQIINDSKAGFVLPPDDSSAIADLLIELADNPSSLGQLEKNARKYAVDNFAKGVVLPHLADLIESLAHKQ